MSKWYCGIDPGKRGAIVAISPKGKILKKLVMPRRVDGEYDLHVLKQKLRRLVRPGRITKVVLEKIHSIQGTGKGAMFTMGEGFGMLKMGLTFAGVEYELTHPMMWQSGVWKKEDVVYKRVKGRRRTDTKATSLNAVKRIFPKVDLRYGDNEIPRKGHPRTKFHDGLVDALLMAEYCRKKYEEE